MDASAVTARYLVTGGAGFIGSNLVEALLRRGEKVRVVDNLLTGREENLAGFAGKFEFIRGDLREARVARAAADGVEVVLHQAAVPSVPRSLREPLLAHGCGPAAFLNVLRAARDAGVRRVVFASSSSVYGAGPELPKVERLRPDPVSPYAVSKLACELYARLLGREWGVSTVCLRYFNVFGARQDPASRYAAVIPAFVTAMLAGRRPTVYGDGLQSRDFCHVENVVRANLLAAAADVPAGEVMNVACGRSITILDLVAELNRRLGASIEPVHAGPRPGEVRATLADVSKARRLIGYEPAVSFEEGLGRAVEWYRSRPAGSA